MRSNRHHGRSNHRLRAASPPQQSVSEKLKKKLPSLLNIFLIKFKILRQLLPCISGVGIKYNQDSKLVGGGRNGGEGGSTSTGITNAEIGPDGGAGSAMVDTPFSSSMDIHQPSMDTMTLDNSLMSASSSVNGSAKTKSAKAMGLFNPNYSAVGKQEGLASMSENLVMDNIELDSSALAVDEDGDGKLDINAVFSSSSGDKEKSGKKFLFKKSSSKKKGDLFKK
jgi:hypothetical protein